MRAAEAANMRAAYRHDQRSRYDPDDPDMKLQRYFGEGRLLSRSMHLISPVRQRSPTGATRVNRVSSAPGVSPFLRLQRQAYCDQISTRLAAVHESGYGPGLPTWRYLKLGSFLGYTVRDAGLAAEAAPDPL